MKNVFDVAYELAQKYHKHQKYGDMPYITHIDEVIASLSQKWGTGNKDLLAIAALHDIIEDTELSSEDLQELVGKDVTKCVVALSKVEGEKYEDYIHRVKEYHYSKEVKVHDTLCNLIHSIRADSAYRVKKYSNQLQLLVS